MRIALGLKAHSGWAALVAVGADEDGVRVLDRRRIELVEQADALWAKQPYHAAEGLEPTEGRKLVRRGIEAARQAALREVGAAVERAKEAGHTVVACAVLVGEPMPDWSVDEILAVHFRMHKAEGVLFREALLIAATELGINSVAIPEKLLAQHAERVLMTPANTLKIQLARLRKSVGPPWGTDQKEAALAAMTALQAHRPLRGFPPAR